MFGGFKRQEESETELSKSRPLWISHNIICFTDRCGPGAGTGGDILLWKRKGEKYLTESGAGNCSSLGNYNFAVKFYISNSKMKENQKNKGYHQKVNQIILDPVSTMGIVFGGDRKLCKVALFPPVSCHISLGTFSRCAILSTNASTITMV